MSAALDPAALAVLIARLTGEPSQTGMSGPPMPAIRSSERAANRDAMVSIQSGSAVASESMKAMMLPRA